MFEFEVGSRHYGVGHKWRHGLMGKRVKEFVTTLIKP